MTSGKWFSGASVAARPRLDHPDHPDHALYQQARSGVHRLDAEMHRTPDQRSDNLAAALTVEARRNGLTRIDQVALSGIGERAFAMQHGAHAPMAHVQTADAVQTSIANSSAAWAQAAQQAVAVKAPLQEVQPPQQAEQAMGR
ncbi:XVIPCD domain-containing protein [Rhodanobacter sp. FW102-FHT14D06]|uniref:XVIPCD domain-containing protein n=2 Tax=unclassified Rhodanobacter TaxID=2621553 RepID=A0AB74UZS7_9GAMM